jgi:hypothetical protein
MSGRRSWVGDSKVGCAIWVLIVIVVGMIAWKAVPVKIASSELYDFMIEQAKFAGTTPPAVLRKHILEKANQLNLPVAEKQVIVERHGDNIRMRCTYTVPLEFPGYTYNWTFKHEVNRPIFIV